MTVIVDTREQQPFYPCKLYIKISGGYDVERRTLNVGDYTTINLLRSFAIERKSLQDLYGTVVQRHARFRREIIRAEERGVTLVVVVEGTHNEFINKKFPRGNDRKTKPETLRKIVQTIKNRYGIEFKFCKNRETAKIFTLKRLLYEERKLKKNRR